MHYMILIKVRAESGKKAMEHVKFELEQTVGPGKTFDYVSGIKLLTGNNLSAFLRANKCASAEEVEHKWGTENRKEDIEQYMSTLRRNVLEFLAQDYLPKKDLPLLMCEKSFNERMGKGLRDLVEQRLKSGESGKLPENFTGLVDVVVRVLDTMTMTKGPLHFLLYILNKIDGIRSCGGSVDKDLLLNTLDNHFVDLTKCGDQPRVPSKTKVYYLIADRHS